MPNERFSRQADVVPADRLAVCCVTVVGVGAVGRQCAMQLASMGVRHLQLVDFDRVEEHNVVTQGYREADIGLAKVNATAEACRAIDASIEIEAIDSRFRRNMDVGDVLFAAVDSIEVRRLLWEAVRDRVAFYADARATAETIRVLTACDRESRAHYPTTLFARAEAHAGSCTSKMTIFTAAIAAGLLASQFSRWLRGLPTDRDVTLNLLASELAVL
ncbi:MAG: ThiF family adenylyltransferase [Phycisphaerae bacterium]